MPGYPCCCAPSPGYVDVVNVQERFRLTASGSTQLWTASPNGTNGVCFAPSFAGECLTLEDTGTHADEVRKIDIATGGDNGLLWDIGALPGVASYEGMWQEANGVVCVQVFKSPNAPIYTIDPGGSTTSRNLADIGLWLTKIGSDVFFVSDFFTDMIYKQPAAGAAILHIDLTASSYSAVSGMVSDGSTLYLVALRSSAWRLLSVGAGGSPSVTELATLTGASSSAPAFGLTFRDTPSNLLYVLTGGSSLSAGDKVWRYDLTANSLDLILAKSVSDWGLSADPGFGFVAEDGT